MEEKRSDSGIGFIRKPTPQTDSREIDPKISEGVEMAFAKALTGKKIVIDQTKEQRTPVVKIPYNNPDLQKAVKDFQDDLDDTVIVHAPPLKKDR